MARADFLETDKLVYDCSPSDAKKHFDGLKVEYDKAKTFFSYRNYENPATIT